tara:strand:+ start:1023 stop:1181 length:159 start_codon:yes stop_codon:yes gene_type:complete
MRKYKSVPVNSARKPLSEARSLLKISDSCIQDKIANIIPNDERYNQIAFRIY